MYALSHVLQPVMILVVHIASLFGSYISDLHNVKTVEEKLSGRLQIPADSGWSLCVWQWEAVVLLQIAEVGPGPWEINRCLMQSAANNPNTIMVLFSSRSIP